MPIRSALPDGRVRQIRNIQVGGSSDLNALLRAQHQGGLRLPSAPINAYAAALQLDTQDADFVFFTSWLSPIVRGEIYKRGQDSLRDEVLLSLGCKPDATNAEAQGLLLSKCRWVMPLCSHHLRAEHWVLMELQLDTRRIILRDSIIDSGAELWAPKLFVMILEAILREFAISAFEPAQFSCITVSPPKMDAQWDSWSCGLFVLMGMHAIATGSEGCVKASEKSMMAAIALERLLKLPFAGQEDCPGIGEPVAVAPIPPDRVPSPQYDVEYDRGDELIEDAMDCDAQDPLSDDGGPSASTDTDFCPASDCSDAMEVESQGRGGSASNTELLDDSVNEHSETGPRDPVKRDWFHTATRLRKRKTAESSGEDDSDDERDLQDDTEAKRARRSAAASGSRAPKQNATIRETTMRADSRLKLISPYEVTCTGCQKTIKLDSRRLYIIANFEKHAAGCSAFTGVQKPKKSKGKKNAKPVVPNRTISSMFAPKTRQPPTAPQTARGLPEPSASVSAGASAPASVPASVPSGAPALRRICTHLRGGAYDEYIMRTQTRNFGGVGPIQRVTIARSLFPYKPFPATSTQSACNADGSIPIPSTGNSALSVAKFTDEELRQLDANCAAHCRWIVDHSNRCVRAKACSGFAESPAGLSESCSLLRSDEALQKVVRRMENEAKLPEDEQHKILQLRQKYSNAALTGPDERYLQGLLKDPVAFSLWKRLEKGESTECFIKLYELARDGKLSNFSTFKSMCEVLANQVERATSGNKKSKHGIRYSREYLDFMILCRSHGSNSARQFAILRSQTGGPCLRTMRALVANSEDALQNPDLILENVARVKRLADTLHWTGPICAAGDCTKVRSRLAYSHRYGGHILGSILPMNECEVNSPEDIDKVIARIKATKSVASQCRAILLQIPDPRAKPTVVALIAVNGKDDAERIYDLDMRLQRFCAHVGLPLIAVAADGAAPEIKAMKLVADTLTASRLTYTNTEYGIRLSAPIFEGTGPLICVTDPDHARKTARNQPQYGTHTASIGSSSIVNCNLLELQALPEAGLMVRDVKNTDKQDDGAARRLFHSQALHAMVDASESGEPSVKEGFHGLFAYLSCLGLFFEAWANRRMSHAQRVLAAFRLRFFLHIWASHIDRLAAKFPDLYSRSRSFISSQSFHILNLSCDSLVLLVLAHAEHYPDVPFCPWLYGTPFVEHFFGLARMILPNFTYAEFLEMVKHVMVRQNILLTGKYDSRGEKDSAAGYSLDYDASPLTAEDRRSLAQYPTRSDLDHLAALAAKEAIALCNSLVNIAPPSLPWHLAALHVPLPSKRAAAQAASTDSDPDSDCTSSDDESSTEADDEENAVDPTASEDDPDSADVSGVTASAAADTARYSALCADLDNALAEASAADSTGAEPTATPSSGVVASIPGERTPSRELESQILEDGQLSLSRLLAFRKKVQSGTRVRSERTVIVDPKFELARFNAGDLQDAYKMKPSEASHRVRVAQDVDPTVEKPMTARQHRWLTVAKQLAEALPQPHLIPSLSSKNVNSEHPLQPGCFVIVQTKVRIYLGRVRELYVRGESKRHNGVDYVTSTNGLSNMSLTVFLPVTRSDEDADDISGRRTEFSCMYGKTVLSTHAPAKQLLYNLGRGQLTGKTLTSQAQSRWDIFTGVKVAAFQKILIPGGKYKGKGKKK